MRMDEQFKPMLALMVERGASDLHLSPGAPPRFRLHGQIVDVYNDVLSADDTAAVMKLLAGVDGQNEVTGVTGDTDLAATIDGNRFRGNIAKTNNGLVIALRHLPNKIPDLQELGLPKETIIQLLSRRDGGLFLVTGPTGSGKTTTLASMLDWINHHLQCHVVTIEAPIEYVHRHASCSVDQRELPRDSPNFGMAVRASLRQDPDIILVGEMRDLETISAAVTAAETGHLVLSTLHTNSAAETIGRIIDSFPKDQQEQVRIQLAHTLLAVLSQRLVENKSKRGRHAAFELMIRTDAIAAHIRENKTAQIASTMETGKRLGMVVFDDSLATLVKRGVVDLEMAKQFAHSPKDFESRVK